MTSAPQLARAASGLPADFPPASSGARRPRRTRSRAPSTRTAARRRSGTPSRRRPAGSTQRRHRRGRGRPLPPLARGRRADADLGLGAYRFSVAWPRVQPDGRGRQPRRASTSTTGSSTSCSPRASRRGRRSTTGTCPRRSRRPAAGRRATPLSGSPSYAAIDRRGARRPGEALDHAQRAVVLGVPRLRAAASTRPGAPTAPTPSRPRTTCCSGTGWPSSACVRAVPDAEVGVTLNLYPVTPARRPGRHRRRRAPGRRAAEPAGSSTRCFGAATPRTCVRRPVAGHRRGVRPRRRPRRHRAAARLPRRQLLHPARRRRRRCARAAADVRVRLDSGLATTATGWEVDPRRAGRDADAGCTRDYTAMPIYVTENGAAFDDRSRPTASCTTPSASTFLDDHLAACDAAIAAGRPTRGATSPGRCSTTSSGPRATPSGSASCTSTTRRSERRRRTAAHWYADLIRAHASRDTGRP